MHLSSPIYRMLRDRYAYAPREPVSTFIGLTALIASVGVPVAAAGAIGGFLITTALSVGLSLASQALANRNRSTLPGGQGTLGGSSGALDPAIRSPQTSPLPEQRLVLGTVTTSGQTFFRRWDPPYLWRGLLLAAHECGDLQQLLMNTQAVPLEDPGTGILRAKSAPFYDGSTRFIEISYRNGDANQEIDPIIARDFPTMPTTFQQRGHATVVIKAHYGANDNAHKDLYGSNNVFNPLIRFQGARYFDPRVSGCVLEDPNTWVSGDNASLNFARWLTHPWPNMRLVDPAKIDWDKIAEAADIDDKWRGRADGTKERNHTAAGVILSSSDAFQVARELLTACDGLLINNAGKYYVLPGHPRDPIGTIGQDMLAGGFELHTETPDRDLINIVKTENIDAARDYKPVVGPVLRRDDLIAQDGKALETTLTLPFTEGSARAQRLASRRLLESRGTGSGRSGRKGFSGTFTLEAARYKAGDIVRIEFRDFDKVTDVYQIMKTQRDETLTRITLEAVSYSNARFDWHAPTDEQAMQLDQDVLDAEAA